MKLRSINKIIVSFLASALCFLSIPTNVFAQVEPGEYRYLCHWIEDEDFIEAYEDLLTDLQHKDLVLETECAKKYGNSFNRFRFQRDEISKLPGIMVQISSGLSVFAPGGCKKLKDAMDKLCKKEYQEFKDDYLGIPTMIYGSGSEKIASKVLCDGKYEIKLSRQGSYVIVKHFQ